MRKGSDGGEKKKKIMTFLVATNVVASRPPERRPTGTPTARAKMPKGWGEENPDLRIPFVVA